MPTPTPLPTEILAHIFHYLERLDLYQCLVVSHAWHIQAEAQLYSDVFLDATYKTYTPLLEALKTRRHLLRSFRWRSEGRGSKEPEFDLMDILLDYRPRRGTGGGGGDCGSLDGDWSEYDDGSSEDDADEYNSNYGSFDSFIYCGPLQHFALIPAYKVGPNRPVALRKFSFEGNGRSKLALGSMMYCLTTLTTLKLHFAYNATAKMFSVDVERILESLPYLKEMSIGGWMHDYASAEESMAKRARIKEYAHQAASSDTTTATGSMPQYRLETFTFDQRLVCRTGPDAFAVFKRLGNLKRICILSLMSEYNCSQRSRPWALGRALRDHCPRLEAVETEGSVALWLFDLPILPSSIALQEHAAAVSIEETGVYLQQRRQRLQELEQEELLRGQTAVPFFPQLRELVFGQEHTFSFQDLISLGIQARFLTTLKIRYEVPRRSLLWEMYERDAPFARASSTTGANGDSMDDALIEAMRLRKRRPFIMRDLMLFLQHCSSLQHLSVSHGSFSFQDFTESTGGEQGAEKAPQQLSIRPWACEATLETLDIGIQIDVSQPKEHHALVWKHLGRLHKLRSLSLPFSILNPSFSYGIEGLVEGGLAATVQEIRCLPGWWRVEVEDRKALVLWFARSFPRLVVLGLEHKLAYVYGEDGVEETQFLEDEEVKRCSILKVFIEFSNKRH
ncbi:hypothetical protein BGW39_003323 [Mortierella sp. 14UC]|nr:hypothetical protein BGW39_003323 [Mortierella sp. 14UC]